MIAINKSVQRPEVEQVTLLQAVKAFLKFTENAQPGMSYETRMELRRRHHEALRDAVNREERCGSTLTEVLVALMIVSIGLTSIATLFPLSVVRSVRAAQNTAATDARYNAESAISTYPSILSHPDATVPDARAVGVPNYVFDPVTNNTKDAEPSLSSIQLQGTKNFIFDPLGFAAIRSMDITVGNSTAIHRNRPEHWFGNDPNPDSLANWPSDPPGIPWGIPRYPGTWRPRFAGDFRAADSLVTMPDSWVLQYEFSENGSFTLGGMSDKYGSHTQVTVPGNLQFKLSSDSSTPSMPYPTARVAFISADGALAQYRIITGISSDGIQSVVTWNELTNPAVAGGFEDVNKNGAQENRTLPFSILSQPIGKVRIEIQERRYSWLLTVRQDSSLSTSVDVVVFFNRSMENIAVDEVLYSTVFTQGSTLAAVTYPVGVNSKSGLPLKPFMKRGGFVFDANNALWYKIANVKDDNAGSAVIALQTPALVSTGSPPYSPARAMFPRGVVDVFPLGTKAVSR